MAPFDVKREIRAKLLGWNLSIQRRDQLDDKFIGDVFRDVESLMEMVFEKHEGSPVIKECHKIIDLWPMTRRYLQSLHQRMYRRLRSKANTASPYFCSFSLEMPREVFDIIWKNIINKNSFGNTVNVTPVCVRITITDFRKAVYLFDHMNKDYSLINKEELLMKTYEDGGIAKVVISLSQPMVLMFRVNFDTLLVNYSYGYWNSHGIPQH